MSEVTGPKTASAMAVLSVRGPTGRSFWISVFLLLIFIQMLTSLMLYAGVFIHSDETLVSPFRFCMKPQHGELSCDNRSPVEINTVTSLCFYVSMANVAFALLAMLLAVYAKDRAALWFSLTCQAASSLFILTGIVVFLLLNRSFVSWEHMTLWFYMCVAVQVELVITTALTSVSGRRLTSDWK